MRSKNRGVSWVLRRLNKKDGMKTRRRRRRSDEFRKVKRELELRQLRGLWVSIPDKANTSFLSLIFSLFHTHFQLLFWALLCWLVWTLRATHLLFRVGLYTCVLFFGLFWGFFYVFSCKYLIHYSLNFIRQNDGLVSFGFHMLLALWQSMT